jgi:hypothetical protein
MIPAAASATLFAIQAAAKLGRKVYDVLVDETVEKPMLLPLGDLYANVAQNEAMFFFNRPENRKLIADGGPYFGFSPEDKLKAYRTLLVVNDRIGIEGDPAKLVSAAEIIQNIHGFQQLADGFGAKSPAQRLLGTVFEIGVDYFLANPQALGKNSTASQVVIAFLEGIDETDFAEGSATEIAGDVLSAALHTFQANVNLVSGDLRVTALLGGITESLVAEVDAARSATDKFRAGEFARRAAGSLIRGGLGAFGENLDLFLPKDDKVKKLVGSTLEQVLAGIKGQEDLFGAETLELVFKSALGAVGENPDLLTDKPVVRELITRTLGALTTAPGPRLFSEAAASAVLREALEVVRENVETLINPKRPQDQLLATALEALTQSLATNLAGGGDVKSLLSSRQLVELVRVVFAAVARNPEQLLGDDLSDARRTALAQIIASVAAALGDDPTRLVNGASFIELVRAVLAVAAQNADGLLNLSTATPRTNALFQVLQPIALEVIKSGDPRKLVSRDVFVAIVGRVLPVASANLDLLRGAGAGAVAGAVATALALAQGALKERINGANLSALIEQLLRQVLAGELDLTESNAVEKAARQVLLAL